MIPRPLALAIVCLVSIVWAVNFFARFAVEGYTTDPTIHGIFMVVVGSLVLASRKRGGDGSAGPSAAELLPPGVEPPPGLEQAQSVADALDAPTDPTGGPPPAAPRHARKEVNRG